VSDETVATRPCYASERTISGESFVVSARAPGRWTIAVRPYASNSVGYRLTATVQHETRINMNGVNLARVGERVQLRGTLRGAHGRVLVEASWDGGQEWTTVGIERVKAGGKFAAVFRPRQPGSVRLRASFPETQQYAASSATIPMRVA
jgi:hypothetical protein